MMMSADCDRQLSVMLLSAPNEGFTALLLRLLFVIDYPFKFVSGKIGKKI